MTLAAPPIDAAPKAAIRAPIIVGALQVAPAVVGAAIAVPYLRASLWRDEAATASAASRSLPQLLHLVGHVDPALALYYVGMHLWIAVFGAGEVSLRLPSLLAALGAVLLLGDLARRIAGPVAGVAASVLMAVSPGFFSLYAVDARPYALVVLTAVASAWVAHEIAGSGSEATGRIRLARLAAWSALAALTIGLQVLAAPAILPQLLWVLRGRRGNTRPWAALVAPVVVGIAGLVMAQRGSELQSWVLPVAKRQIVESLLQLVTDGGLLICLAAIPGLVLARRLIDPAARRRGIAAGTVAAGWMLLPPVALLAYSVAVTPSYVPRYYLSAAPGAALFVALVLAGGVRGMSEARRTGTAPRVRAAAIAAMAGASVLALVIPAATGAFAPNPAAEDLRGAAAWIESRQGPHDGIVYTPTYAEAGLRWYLGDAAPRGPRNVQAGAVSAIAAGSLWTPTVRTTDAATLLAGVDRVFVVGYTGPQRWVPVRDVGTPLARDIRRCWVRESSRDFGISVTLWQRPAREPAGCDL